MASRIDRETVSAGEEYELWTLMSQLTDGMLKAREHELRPFGLSAVQVGVIYALRNITGAPTPSEIARWVFREPHTISAALDRMERQGLVKQTRSVQGRRQVLVELTEKGEELYRRQHNKRKVIPNILATLSPDERQQLRGFLERLRRTTLENLVVMPPFP